MATTLPKYKRQVTFRGHSRPINSIQFSQRGSYLASGADDGYIYLWSLSTGQMSDKFNARQGPVVSVEWLDYPSTIDTQYLISAGADGTVKLWKRENDWTKTKFSFVAMYSVSDKVIENIALHNNQLAIVCGGQLVILNVKTSRQDPFVLLHKEPKDDGELMPALARTVHWIHSGRTVLVGYLDAKLLCAWDTSPWKKRWQHKIATRIGNTAWSEDSQTLLVWNLCDGIDVYRIDNGPTWIAKLAMNINRNMVVQMTFVSGTEHVVSGSDNGDIYIWDLSSRSPQQVLHHTQNLESCAVQAVAFTCPQYGKPVVASASSDPTEPQPVICLWSPSPIPESSVGPRKSPSRNSTNWTRPKFRELGTLVALILVTSFLASLWSAFLPMSIRAEATNHDKTCDRKFTTLRRFVDVE